jgi:hypothetical protein
LAQKSTVASVTVTQNNSAAAVQKSTTPGVTTQANPAAGRKSPIVNLPPLGPPPPIPGFATSVSQEMLLAAAAQTSTAKKRPAPKPKAPKSPKKGKPDTVAVSTAGLTTGAIQGMDQAAIRQAIEGMRASGQLQTGTSTTGNANEIEQMVHMIPVDQGDGSTRYILVSVNEGENNEQTLHLDQSDPVEGRIHQSQPQDPDRAEAVYMEGGGSMHDAIAAVHPERLQQTPQLQLAQQSEAGASGNPTISLGNIGNAQQHLINNGTQLQIIDDGTGQQFALDQQQLEALTAGGDGSEPVYYFIDYNGTLFVSL